MHDQVIEAINHASKIVVIQAENPDGDSLGSALALEEILGDLNKQVHLHCPVDIPKYLRYYNGWDRVTSDLDTSADLAVIVDTSAEVLLSKVLEIPGARHFLESTKVVVLDHHSTSESSLNFDHSLLVDDVAATGQLIYDLAAKAGWPINPQAASHLLSSILSDTLGLTTQNVDESTFRTAGKLTSLGASVSEIESRRREFMKKSKTILAYKGRLIERIEYLLEGRLALVHIPWDEIREYSDQYNPSVLVLDEMRLVEGVEIGVAIKTYPDGKLTGKLRSNLPVSASIAGYFGGGGHEYAAGFRVYESLDKVTQELVDITDKTLNAYQEKQNETF